MKDSHKFILLFISTNLILSIIFVHLRWSYYTEGKKYTEVDYKPAEIEEIHPSELPEDFELNYEDDYKYKHIYRYETKSSDWPFLERQLLHKESYVIKD